MSTTTAVSIESTPADRVIAVEATIDSLRPFIQQDGGDLELMSVDTDNGIIEVQLQGSCSSCAISTTTLQAGVTRILKSRHDWVTEVIGSVDEEIDFYESKARGTGAYVPRGSVD
jgi:Fe-S cluster biogenesis protein NfuA